MQEEKIKQNKNNIRMMLDLDKAVYGLAFEKGIQHYGIQYEFTDDGKMFALIRQLSEEEIVDKQQHIFSNSEWQSWLSQRSEKLSHLFKQ